MALRTPALVRLLLFMVVTMALVAGVILGAGSMLARGLHIEG